MATNGFQALYKSLQIKASHAQRKLDEQQTNRLRSVINVDQKGQPEYISWECSVPAGDGGTRTHQMLRLPLASLYPAESFKITELSLEFDCEIKKSKAERSPVKYNITPVGHRTDNNHSLKLVVQEENGYAPLSTIDGMPTSEYLDYFSQQSLLKKKSGFFAHRTTRIILFLLILLALDFVLMFFSNH